MVCDYFAGMWKLYAILLIANRYIIWSRKAFVTRRGTIFQLKCCPKVHGPFLSALLAHSHLTLPIVAEIGLLEVANIQRVLVAPGVHRTPIGWIQQEGVLVPQHLKMNGKKIQMKHFGEKHLSAIKWIANIAQPVEGYFENSPPGSRRVRITYSLLVINFIPTINAIPIPTPPHPETRFVGCFFTFNFKLQLRK